MASDHYQRMMDTSAGNDRRSCTMMMHPELAMALARQHQLDLIAVADRERLLAAVRRRPGAGGRRVAAFVPKLRLHVGDSLLQWAGRQPAPPR